MALRQALQDWRVRRAATRVARRRRLDAIYDGYARVDGEGGGSGIVVLVTVPDTDAPRWIGEVTGRDLAEVFVARLVEVTLLDDPRPGWRSSAQVLVSGHLVGEHAFTAPLEDGPDAPTAGSAGGPAMEGPTQATSER